MEKNTKFSQSSAKGAPTDAKKTQDFTSNKLFPKTSRRREPTATSSFSKYEQPRKCNVQKTKSFDKRPKPKGQYHGSAKEDTKVVQTEVAEPGSVVVHGSKKQNLNHLLNFHYEPREMQSGSGVWSNGKSTKGYSRNSNRWLPPVQRHKYNKEQYLQASYQFVVTANGNYLSHLTDPDTLVDWKLVEQIIVHRPESLSCPICLCTPVAGKMTLCGHVYCWPCILHYLSLSCKPWSKCPICYELIQKSDLKSVTEIIQSTLNIGDIVTLRLMRREKGSMLAVPVGSTTQNPTNFFSAAETISHEVYSKLLIANTDVIMNIIECERVQLKLEMLDNPHSPENCYIEQALNELSKREEELLNEIKSKSEVDAITQEKENIIENEQPAQRELENHEETSNMVNKKEIINDDEENSKIVGNSNISQSPSGVKKFFYFYQADDGQHLYLHAMNVKMLERQYGSLENSPHSIKGKLLEKESGSLTDDLRRRLRYLCHLPLTCQIEIAEIDLKPPILSEEVLTSFQNQLAERHRVRKQREREERKREKKITEEQNKRMGKFPRPNVHIDSQRHFPQWQPELLFSEETVPSPLESTRTSSIASSPSLSTFDEIVRNSKADNTAHEQGPSFAEMLRNTGTRLKSPVAWPSATSANVKSNSIVSAHSFSTDEEEHASPPSQRLGDALAVALEQTKLLEGKKDGGRKKKKKKGKSTLLSATTMAHTS
ncbi:E3 ubiquitin-protein ligase RNF10 isoform X1 [Megalopta genalis]|uniref:E3 ubiquitin-protein ligase RNF10 isoform X1 n=1 Tax=Megalopta genalis TaxID=115081 RepID=UPI003FD48EEA